MFQKFFNDIKNSSLFSFFLYKDFLFRLVENARKTPQPRSTLASNHANVKSQIKNSVSNSAYAAPFLDDLSTQDLGPFFGLPSKVQSLLEELRGIKHLYGKK